MSTEKVSDTPMVAQKEHGLGVDLGKIKYKKVKKFLRDNQLTELMGFRDLKTLGYIHADASSYSRHFKSFIVKENIEAVWQAYKSIPPTEAWGGNMVKFGLGYSRLNDKISYLEDHYTGMEVGQILVLNLNIYGVTNLAVAHEIKEVNEQGKYIKLSYMQHGKAEGSQWIRFHAKDGHTEITHETLYKSNSAFRDKRIYPMLHTKAISEFHSSVKKKLIAMRPRSTT